MTREPDSYPDFDSLPKVDGMPQGCAWGLFDVAGKKDKVGTLNFLTPKVVKRASEEVVDGVSISLNWPLNALNEFKGTPRRATTHTVLPDSRTLEDGPNENQPYWDDEFQFNTQFSSQWDSLCHVSHHPTGLTYNGAKTSQVGLQAASTTENELPTLDHWHSRGGLVGRGVLVDFVQYATSKGIDFHPFRAYRIQVDELEACIAYLGVELLPGDILLIRTGSTEVVTTNMDDVLKDMAQNGARLSGLDGSVKMARWLWNHKVAAVASDAFALEAFPPLKEDGSVGSTADLGECLAFG